jgi:transitional endoplasmic reticulum ATPase
MTKLKKKGSSVERSSQPAMEENCQVLALQLVHAPQQSSSELNQKPSVRIHEQDAFCLNVRNGALIILLAIDETNALTGATICQACLFSSNRASTPVKSPKAASIQPGKIQVTPSSVASLLYSVQEEVIISVQSPQSRQTPPTTPSSAVALTSRFSFQTGGGGDQLYTPSPSKSTSPSGRNSTNKKQQQRVYAVPVQSSLGTFVANRLVANLPARQLDLHVDQDDFDFTNCEEILKRLYMAQCVDRYVQDGQRANISFRGKPLGVTIKRCTTTEEELVAGMNCMQLKSDTDDVTKGEDNSPVIALVKNVVASCSVRLHHIAYSTAIVYDKPSSAPDAFEKTPSMQQYVAGLYSTLEQVRSFLMIPLKNSEFFTSRNMKPPRGLLLHGPSGVGKTSLARQLACEFQLNNSCHVEFVNCTSLQSKATIVGHAERELSRLFRRRSSSQPTLLIFDDIHLICPKRAGGYNQPGTDRLTATLLSLLDGVVVADDDIGGSSIVVLAITTNPSVLDPALRRPGRLDQEVEVPIPDEASTRAEILRFHSDRAGCSTDISDDQWLELAKLAKGFNGADCLLAVKEAVRQVVFRTMNERARDEPSRTIVVSFEDFKAAIRMTKPSAIKSISVEIPQVRWSDIGGMDEVKRDLRDAIELPMSHGTMLEQLGVPPPRGILLYGPPGCSKTLMARALATEGQMNFLAVKGPELLSKWLGESERALASLFRRARMASPAIIFFDEIDAIATKRGSSDSASGSRLLSQLLTELDGVRRTAHGKQRVVVVGATNRPDLLDSALTRPGRIDRMIYVGPPDAESRKQIFELSLCGRSCSDDIDIPYLSGLTSGFSGAEVVAMCRDAALLALEESEEHLDVAPMIQMKHLVAAIQDSKRNITPAMIAFYAAFANGRNTTAQQ